MWYLVKKRYSNYFQKAQFKILMGCFEYMYPFSRRVAPLFTRIPLNRNVYIYKIHRPWKSIFMYIKSNNILGCFVTGYVLYGKIKTRRLMYAPCLELYIWLPLRKYRRKNIVLTAYLTNRFWSKNKKNFSDILVLLDTGFFFKTRFGSIWDITGFQMIFSGAKNVCYTYRTYCIVRRKT